MSARGTGGRGPGRGAARGAHGGRRRARGRLVVAAALLAFVLVATAVIWRRGVGIAHARELRALAARRAQLLAERAALESAVRAAAGRARIGGVAEQRLGMRVPSDTQVVLLSRAGDVSPGTAPPDPSP